MLEYIDEVFLNPFIIVKKMHNAMFEHVTGHEDPTADSRRVPLFEADLTSLRIQRLDLPTVQFLLERFYEDYPVIPASIHDVFPNYLPFDIETTRDYMPHPEWFEAGFMDSIHGYPCHQRRVVFAAVLSQVEELDSRERALAMIACGMNDIVRHDDRNTDLSKNHAVESAAYFLSVVEQFQKRGCNLSDDEIAIIAYLIAHHESGISSADGEDSGIITPSLARIGAVHSDVIALDRFRLPKTKWRPDPKRLKLASACSLLPLMGQALLLSEYQYHRAKLMHGDVDYLSALGPVLSEKGIIHEQY